MLRYVLPHRHFTEESPMLAFCCLPRCDNANRSPGLSLSCSPSFLDTLRNRLATPIQTMMYSSHHHAPLFASVRACPNHVERTSRRNGINLSHCGLNTPRLSPSGPLKSEGHQKEHVQARHHPPQRPHPLPLTHDLGNPITYKLPVTSPPLPLPSPSSTGSANTPHRATPPRTPSASRARASKKRSVPCPRSSSPAAPGSSSSSCRKPARAAGTGPPSASTSSITCCAGGAGASGACAARWRRGGRGMSVT